VPSKSFVKSNGVIQLRETILGRLPDTLYGLTFKKHNVHQKVKDVFYSAEHQSAAFLSSYASIDEVANRFSWYVKLECITGCSTAGFMAGFIDMDVSIAMYAHLTNGGVYTMQSFEKNKGLQTTLGDIKADVCFGLFNSCCNHPKGKKTGLSRLGSSGTLRDHTYSMVGAGLSTSAIANNPFKTPEKVSSVKVNQIDLVSDDD
jgi:hypothetical protein